MTQWKDKLTSTGVRRAAIGLYVAGLAALIVAFMSVSLMQVEHAAYIQGAKTLERGRPNAMRGIVLDAPTGQFVTRARVDLSLVDGAYDGEESLERLAKKPATSIAGGHIPKSGHIHLNGRVPEDVAPGDYALVLDVESPDFENFKTGTNVTVAQRTVPEDYWPERTERLPEDSDRRGAKTVESSEGPVRVDLWPKDGQVARGLKSVVYLRTVDRETGQPVSTEVRFEKVEGLTDGELPAKVETDELGLARVEFAAMTDQTWTLTAGSPAQSTSPKPSDSKPSDSKPSKTKPSKTKPSKTKPSKTKPSKTKLHITSVPTQVSVQMHEVLAVGGDKPVGSVYSLFNTGGVMVDLYNADDWVDAKAYGIRPDVSQFQVAVPELDERALLYRVQVYRSLYDAGNAWDVDYLVAADGKSLGDLKEAAGQLAALLAAHTDDPYFDALAASDIFATTSDARRLRRWIDAMLEVVPRHLDDSPSLINSQKTAREKLEAWKDDVKSDLMVLTALALLIGLAVVGYLVVLGIRSHQKQNRLLRDVDFEMSLEEGGEASEELDKTIADANAVVALQIFIVVATLIFFTLGILLLFSHM